MRTQRTALGLYTVLLVLPTLVLGGLQWRQIVHDKEAELAAVPLVAGDAARRLGEGVQARLEALLSDEEARPFQHYAAFFCPDGVADDQVALLPSPLASRPRPTGVLAWFAFDLNEDEGARVDLFWGGSSEARERHEGDLELAARDLIRRNLSESLLRQAGRLGNFVTRETPLLSVAANRAGEADRECLRAQRELLCESQVRLVISQFHLRFYTDRDGRPRAVAARRVLMEGKPELRGLNDCLHRLSNGLGLMQGFFIDPDWLFYDLPDSVARSVLDPSQRYVGVGEPDCCDGRQAYHAQVRLVEELAFDVPSEREAGFGTVKIAIDTRDIEARFRSRTWRFLGVAAMLALSLGTGLVLLLRSVGKDLEQAERTENFVAAVTHELRTPLSSIRLHGEMLLDGWAPEPAKQKEYYRRIVRETERLSTLVERVLEKARLSAGAAPPVPGDLNEALAAALSQIAPPAPDGTQRPDLELDLAPDLPEVLLSQEAISSILVNLVENARKYAPFDPARSGSEPIRVVTRAERGRVLLEVQDRGPGIPAEERERVFEAFYRVGNEATRTSRGTGLGLHLVALQAEAIGARVRAHARPGGGSIFRVSFAPEPGAV